MKRPLVAAALFYGIGIWVGQWMGKGSLGLWGLAAFFVLLAVVLYRYQRNAFWPMLAALFLLGMIAFQGAAFRDDSIPEIWLNGTKEMSGQIVEAPVVQEDRIIITLGTVFLHTGQAWGRIPGHVRLTVYLPTGSKKPSQIYAYGQRMTLYGKLMRPQQQRNWQGFDYRAYLLRRGVYYTASAREQDVIRILDSRKRWDAYAALLHIRERMTGVIDRWIGGEEGGILKGILLGDKTEILEETRQNFSDTGVAHILAISGLHVGYVILFFSALFSYIRWSPRKTLLAMTVLLLLYCALTGFTPSVLRASLMAVTVLGAKTFGRKADPLTSMAAAFLLILWISPLSLFEVSFQLSFGAVSGILLLYDTLKNKMGWLPKSLGSSLAVSMSAQLGVLPVIIFYFNKLSIISLVANLLVIPLTGVVVLTGMAAVLLGSIWSPLAFPLAWITKGLIFCVLLQVKTLAYVPYATISVATPNPLLVVLYYSGLLILTPVLRLSSDVRVKGTALVILGMIAAFTVPLLFPYRGLELHFLDVGQGDSALIITPRGKTFLVDGGGTSAGSTSRYDVGESVIVPYLIKRGITHLDGVILSHGHNDHIGGLISVMENIPISRIYQPFAVGKNDPAYDELIKLAEDKKVPVYKLKARDRLTADGVIFDVLHPEGKEDDPAADSNNCSLVMRIEYQAFSILFAGDMEREVEEELLQQSLKEVNVIKAAHHGSNTSSSQPWIDRLDPELVIISVGKNQYGHPSPAVLERFKGKAIPIYRTDECGEIILRYDRGRLKVRPHIAFSESLP